MLKTLETPLILMDIPFKNVKKLQNEYFKNKSICFGCFDRHPKHRNKPKQNFQWFRK